MMLWHDDIAYLDLNEKGAYRWIVSLLGRYGMHLVKKSAAEPEFDRNLASRGRQQLRKKCGADALFCRI